VKRHTLVFVSCSPHPRVGKTLTARLLTDYYLADGRAVLAYDTNPHDSALVGLFPDLATMTDLGNVRGQVALFDRLLIPDGIPKVVDLWHPSFRPFFALSQEMGFFEEAGRSMIHPVLLFHNDPTPTALEARLNLAKQWPHVAVVAVKNDGTTEIGADTNALLSGYSAERCFTISRLDPVAKRALFAPGFSIAQFVRDPPEDVSIVLRVSLRAWIGRIFTQFRSFELRHSMEDQESLG